jgi:hypothetical protein
VLNFLVESFGLLNDLFPLPSILDAGYPVFVHLADVLFDVILPSVLGSSLWSFGWCIWLVDLFECMMMHGLTNPKFEVGMSLSSFQKIRACSENFRKEPPQRISWKSNNNLFADSRSHTARLGLYIGRSTGYCVSKA